MHHSKETVSYVANPPSKWFTSSLPEYIENDILYNTDGIYYYLASFYHVPKEYISTVNFKAFLGVEYKQALKHIYEAIGFFDNHPEAYILKTDIFNQVLLSCIFKADNRKIKYELGSMIGKFQKQVNGSCHGLQSCHDLRGNSGMIHAYNKNEEIENKKPRTWWFIKAKNLKNELSISYKYLYCRRLRNELTSLATATVQPLKSSVVSRPEYNQIYF